MPAAEQILYAVMLEKALLEKREQEFEDFFVLAGTTLWGPDFEPWRPQGPLGDMKCDGYRISEKAVFQCYAPENFNASKVAAKIQADFTGARDKFGTKMEKWVFVHNHRDGLPAEAAMLGLELRKAHPGITIETWTPNYLIKQILNLPESDIGTLFPTLAKGLSFLDATLEFLEEAFRENRAARRGIDFEPRDELNRRALDDALDNLDEADREVRRRVLGYSRWYDPAVKTEVFENLGALGYEQKVVENNAQRLHDAGMIQITENHYLPLDEEICQQAAESLMDEFLRELEE